MLLPSAGQGAVGIECRSDDHQTKQLLEPLNHSLTAARVTAERAMNHHLEGGCQVPIGAFAELKDDELLLRGLVGEVDGSRLLTFHHQAPISEAKQLGILVGEALKEQGADKIIQALLQQQA